MGMNDLNEGSAMHIEVEGDSGIAEVRLQIRRMAHRNGFDMPDQARISMAASSVAYTLGTGSSAPCRVTIDLLQEDNRLGLRVVCLVKDRTARAGDISYGTFDDTRWMVDEFAIEKLPAEAVQVTLIKWKSG